MISQGSTPIGGLVELKNDVHEFDERKYPSTGDDNEHGMWDFVFVDNGLSKHYHPSQRHANQNLDGWNQGLTFGEFHPDGLADKVRQQEIVNGESTYQRRFFSDHFSFLCLAHCA
jgi:hypothetical protein